MLAATFPDRYDDRRPEGRWSPIRPQTPDELSGGPKRRLRPAGWLAVPSPLGHPGRYAANLSAVQACLIHTFNDFTSHHEVARVLTICLATTHALGEKPTRDQIVQLSQTCKEQQKRMDLVAEFGTDLSGLDLSGVDFLCYYAVGYETRI